MHPYPTPSHSLVPVALDAPGGTRPWLSCPCLPLTFWERSRTWLQLWVPEQLQESWEGEREVTLVLLFMENTAAFRVFLLVQTQFKQKRNPGEMAESIALPRQHELGGHFPSCESVFLFFTLTGFLSCFVFHF